ncbi:helix-turn-helix transcriptional regulator [Planococcus lenghuensis]|uniref:HTH merR-type domain-containing protein n=1 Tax=Planococcus lenghuensis TaxID=2213202 RepID=A0A1Q2L4X8_9BACL|nr:MerR family transcriptional regulator [Planococcus lenghuensis]AQQ55489.1 hypothetical protein B0X71_20280 [Planococcus lenghuensis]
MSKDFYRIGEVADLLGVQNPTVYKYASKGLIERMPDPHRLSRGGKYSRESVDRLVRQKQETEAAGRSINDVAEGIGVSAGKVRKAIEELELDVKKVEAPFEKAAYRFAITPEQEDAIARHLQKRTTTRPKRNQLYLPQLDAVLYQSFRIAGDQFVRLREHSNKGCGFYLEHEQFISIQEGLKTYNLQPRYAIHSQRKRDGAGFTDITVRFGTPEFYQILDVLLATCGVENFNLEILNRRVRIAIRNGRYPRNEFATLEAAAALQKHITGGLLTTEEGEWTFYKDDKLVTLDVPIELYQQLERQAKAAHMSPKEYMLQVLAKQGKQT